MPFVKAGELVWQVQGSGVQPISHLLTPSQSLCDLSEEAAAPGFARWEQTLCSKECLACDWPALVWWDVSDEGSWWIPHHPTYIPGISSSVGLGPLLNLCQFLHL